MTLSAEQKARGKAQRDAWRLKGLCIRCGVPKANGMACCPVCVERNRVNKVRGWRVRAEAGVCVRCGGASCATRATGKSRIYCDEHAEEARTAGRKSYLASRSQPARVASALCRAAKSRAARDGMEFSLRPIDLLPLPERCPILGIPLQHEYRAVKGPRNDSYSVDRIDNSKGYTPGNVRIVSYRANRLRSDATPEELRALVLDAEAIAAAAKEKN